MLLRQLEYLTALARERHFARAAESCHVSQPALSAAIRKLEAELDVPIVRRGARFEGFTPEGERVLRWAYRILAERDGLTEELGVLRAGLTGRLRIGAIPTALTTVPLLTVPFAAEHPLVTVSVLSLPSADIHRQLAEFELDLGLTYLGGEPPPGLRASPLYRERYVLLTHAEGRFATAEAASWAEAARLPLCLLTPDMHNRRVLDEIFRSVDAEPAATVETNSVAALYAHVHDGRWAGVVPHAWLRVFGVPAGMRALPLVDPVASRPVGLVRPDRDPEPILARALLEVARRGGVQRELDRLLPGSAARGGEPRPGRP
ncbi:LysR family transcriptional regulator [Allonocardiopsis opalescens]|uniref:DNA-binding transcriptional LysR family regulator n=1 Tax=Allonocardiopsis opalescens TaxID=1144618 RepID=A0A2T0Q862_9ACTN|nr:LysR family transcriptional regulator [Allonocardiopsis opalescens]PRY00010.1 DNA-binding transcriptional LysR family regulator [Allonocardiopsis opalescens]